MTTSELFRAPTPAELVAIGDRINAAAHDLLQAVADHRRMALGDADAFSRRDRNLDGLRDALTNIVGPLGDRIKRG